MSNKQQKLNALCQQLYEDTDIVLRDQLNDRNSICWSHGNPDAQIVIVGEVPGYKECSQGEMFVGDTGDWYAEQLQQCDIDPKSVYYTSIVKIRSMEKNYESRIREFREHGRYFIEEMQIVQPRIIIPIGGRVVAYLLKECDTSLLSITGPEQIVEKETVGNMVGKYYTVEIGSIAVWVMPVYHHGFFIYGQEDADEKKKKMIQEKLKEWREMMRGMHPLFSHDPRHELCDLRITGNEQLHAKHEQYPYIEDPNRHIFHDRPVAPFNPGKDVIFQVMDMQYDKKRNIFQTFGRTAAGQSVYCAVSGVQFQFYLKPPSSDWTIDAVRTAYCEQNSLEEWSKTRMAVVRCEPVQKQNFFGYAGESTQTFIRVIVSSHAVIRPLALAMYALGYQIFETHVNANTQMMLARGIYSAGWITAQAIHTQDAIEYESTCDIEISLDAQYVHGHDAQSPEWSHNAPCRVLSFDIECYRNNKGFPNALHNPVVCIVCTVETIDSQIRISTDPTSLGNTEYDRVDVFVCGTCDPVKHHGARVHCFYTEEDMLVAWSHYIVQIDPDIVTGFNSKNFDERYLIDRANRLGLRCRGWCGIGRLHRVHMSYYETKFFSRAFGERRQIHVRMPGRVNLDLLEVFLRDFAGVIHFKFLGTEFSTW